MNYIQDILSDIEDESCVLIIGPDLVDFGEKSFFEVMCEDLLSDDQYNHLIDSNPQYIFFHEELLQLKTSKEMGLLRYVDQFYKKQSQYDEPFRKISRIPFHLIISLLPDARLQRIFSEQKLDFEYSHYPKEEDPRPVNLPNKETPLIYNLLGDLSKKYAILTFDHLFVYLSGIMGKRELPQGLQQAYKQARTFIFLGVHFERWYVQLLLRIITTRETEKYTILKNGSKNELCTFIARRLELDFIDMDPLNFLDQLYDECVKRGLAKFTRRVFISYSHKDKETASRIEAYLKSKAIDVSIDDSSMSGGQKIEAFIEMIKDIDCVLIVVSKHSLLSPWVSKEIITTVQKTNKYFLPCYIDDAFLDKNFSEGVAKKFVEEKIREIHHQTALRGLGDKTVDLDTERDNWAEYYRNLPVVLNELNTRKCISLKDGDFDENMPSVIQDIKNSQK